MADTQPDPSKPRFYKVFQAVLADERLSAIDALVDAYLYDWYAWKGVSRPGLRRISDDLGISSGRAAAAVNNLVQAGLWTVEKPATSGSRETSRYTPADSHPAVIERSAGERSVDERSVDGRSAQPVSAERSARERSQTNTTRLNNQTDKKARSPRIGQIDFPKATAEAVTEAVTGLPADRNGNGQPTRHHHTPQTEGIAQRLGPKMMGELEKYAAARQQRTGIPFHLTAQRLGQIENLVAEIDLPTVGMAVQRANRDGRNWPQLLESIRSAEREKVWTERDVKRKTEPKPQPRVHIDDPRRYHKQEAEG